MGLGSKALIYTKTQCMSSIWIVITVDMEAYLQQWFETESRKVQ